MHARLQGLSGQVQKLVFDMLKEGVLSADVMTDDLISLITNSPVVCQLKQLPCLGLLLHYVLDSGISGYTTKTTEQTSRLEGEWQ